MRYGFIVMVVIFFACSRENKNHNISPSSPDYALPEVRSQEKYSLPVSFALDWNKLRKIPAGNPVVITGGSGAITCPDLPGKRLLNPDTCRPGRFGIGRPAALNLRKIPVSVKEPDVIQAGNMGAKDQNPASFSYFGKLQGLHLLITCMLEDRRGNLWFGTLGGGLTRYDGKNFSHFNEKSGLNQNRIQCLAEDRSGNIWIGTSTGAILYDGKQFFSFSSEAGFPETMVQSICEDNAGNIWFGTFAGALRYNGKSLEIFTRREGLPSNDVNCMMADRKGRVWIGTDGGGLSVYDGNQFLNFKQNHGLSSDYIISLLEDDDGKIWVGTSDQGVCCIKGDSVSSLSSREGLSGDKIWSICKDRTGSIWFGSESSGLTRYDGKTCTRFGEDDGLSNNEVHDLLLDSHGNLWIATFGGVNKYQGNSFTHFTEKEGLGNNRVNGIIQDKNGLLWFGTSGGGLTSFDGKRFYRYSDAEGLSDNFITCLFEDHNNKLWIGTKGAGLLCFDGKEFVKISEEDGLQNNAINCITEDKNGNIWFGTYGGGASRFDGKTISSFTLREGLSSNEVNSILIDKQENVWFGTSGGGLVKFDGKHYTCFRSENGLVNNEVFCLMEDRAGNIWAGTGGGGISVLCNGNLYSLGREEGLSNTFVFSLMEDKAGRIWAGTRNGLNRLNISGNVSEKILQNPDEHLFLNYAYEDGFLAMGCNLNAMYEDKSGTIWVGGNDRLTAVKSGELMADTIPPVIEISSIDLFNEKISWSNWTGISDSSRILKNGEKIEGTRFDSLSRWTLIPENLSLAHNSNNITFHFTGITSNRPRKLKYQYQLQGSDQNWSSPSFNTEASWSNLPFGDYVFRVRAMNSEGIWSKEASYPFSIRPPWWRTWWAYGAYLIITVSGFSAFIKFREKSLKDRQKQLETEISRATLEIRNQTEVIEEERKRSDALLTNILPEKIAEELKTKGAAEARLHEAVSVLFTDFSDFTGISAGMSPDELVKDLHECFSEFDRIVQKHGLEKIKVIGDSYMAASGIPEARPSHAIDCVQAALEIQAIFQKRRKEKMKSGSRYYDLRIGIHSGPVVAGVVGFRKFQYDIWGDTVNTASRMESSGAEGQINISEETHLLVQGEFECEYRGEQEAKGKGRVRMYFVRGPKAAL